MTLYNRFYLGLRGLDQFPKIPCVSCNWAVDLISWAHDKIIGRGDGFVGGPRLGGWSSRARNGFQRVPEEEEGILRDGRFSLDDDDDEESYRREGANGNGNAVNLPNDWESIRNGMGSDGVIRL